MLHTISGLNTQKFIATMINNKLNIPKKLNKNKHFFVKLAFIIL